MLRRLVAQANRDWEQHQQGLRPLSNADAKALVAVRTVLLRLDQECKLKLRIPPPAGAPVTRRAADHANAPIFTRVPAAPRMPGQEEAKQEPEFITWPADAKEVSAYEKELGQQRMQQRRVMHAEQLKSGAGNGIFNAPSRTVHRLLYAEICGAIFNRDRNATSNMWLLFRFWVRTARKLQETVAQDGQAAPAAGAPLELKTKERPAHLRYGAGIAVVVGKT